MRSRWFFATGMTFALMGSMAALADPLPDVAGTYKLTGSEGGRATKVKLVVGDDGSVKRSVTFNDDGSTKEYAGTVMTLTGKALVVDFAVPTSGSTAGVKDPRNLAGVWGVRGRNGTGAYSGRANFVKRPNGTYLATFGYTYDGSTSSGTAQVDASLNGMVLSGKRLRTTGLIGSLISSTTRKPVAASYTLSADGLKLTGSYAGYAESFTRLSVPTTGGTPPAPKVRGNYQFDDVGGVAGTVSAPVNANESGAKDDPSALKIVSPKDGAVLVGQVLDVLVQPSQATWEVVAGSPARKAVNGRLQITGKGEVSIVAKLADRTSEPVKLNAVALEVVAVTVDKAQAIKDAPAPHSVRTFASQDKGKETPAAILVNEKLTIRAKIQAPADLAATAKVKLAATGSGNAGVKLSGEGELSALKNGQEVTLVSEAPLNAKIDVNVFELTFKLETEAGINDAGSPPMAMRVYTMFKPQLRNGPYFGEQSRELMTKNHVDMVCQWAKGTSKNVGNGPDSICYNLDNQVRHHVHPVDFKPGKEPYAPAYEKNQAKPVNYDDLPSAYSARSSGERGVSQLYYPPLDVTNPAKEDYRHYASNFGWWLLDNKTHTGGRCNQQASLMCDLFGTMGIKASVHYLQRVGTGKQSGRPVRQYFNSDQGGQYWNFHGLAKAQLDDGSWWLYDGSFSFAPSRKNGRLEWAEAPGRWLNQTTPFIYEFGPWYYEDYFGGRVPSSDIPTQHVQGDDPGQGEYVGIPKAQTEDLDWYNKSNPGN